MIGINLNNLDALGKLVDVNKDLSTIKYHKVKEEAIMRGRSRYGNRYDEEEYGRGRMRDSRGRYMRGNRNSGRYGHGDGEEIIDGMYCYYGEYDEGRRRGSYGKGSPETLKSLEYMLQSVVDFVEMLKDEADSDEELAIIREYSRKIAEM